MKKLFVGILMLVLSCLLCACATVKTDITLTQERDQIQSVQIYKLETVYDEGNVDSLCDENTPAFIVEKNQQDGFLDELCDLDYEKEVVLLPIPMDGGCDYEGYVIAVVYKDGGYDLIARQGQYYYSPGDDAEGAHKYGHADYCGEKSWIEFVEEYIVVE